MKKLLTVLLLLFCTSLIHAKIKPNDRLLIPYRAGKKWGFCDTNGRVFIKPAYDRVELFEHNLAVVTDSALISVINKRGKVVFSCALDSIDEISIVSEEYLMFDQLNTSGLLFRIGKGRVSNFPGYLLSTNLFTYKSADLKMNYYSLSKHSLIANGYYYNPYDITESSYVYLKNFFILTENPHNDTFLSDNTYYIYDRYSYKLMATLKGYLDGHPSGENLVLYSLPNQSKQRWDKTTVYSENDLSALYSLDSVTLNYADGLDHFKKSAEIKRGKLCGVIDSTGNTIIPLKYTYIQVIDSFYIGQLNNSVFEFVDPSRKLTFPGKFYTAYKGKRGIYLFTNEGHGLADYFLLNDKPEKIGTFFIQSPYEITRVWNLNDDYFLQYNGEYSICDAKGQVIGSFNIFAYNNRWGLGDYFIYRGSYDPLHVLNLKTGIKKAYPIEYSNSAGDFYQNGFYSEFMSNVKSKVTIYSKEYYIGPKLEKQIISWHSNLDFDNIEQIIPGVFIGYNYSSMEFYFFNHKGEVIFSPDSLRKNINVKLEVNCTADSINKENYFKCLFGNPGEKGYDAIDHLFANTPWVFKNDEYYIIHTDSSTFFYSHQGEFQMEKKNHWVPEEELNIYWVGTENGDFFGYANKRGMLLYKD
ncbi:MAG: WG repeat-containing protein [Flavobacteriales bacterium]